MFVGRDRELASLEELYRRQSFEMLVLYGRRRIGKTALIEEFAADKKAIFFTAQLQSDKDNLGDFSRVVASCLGFPESTPPFFSWLDAFAFIADRSKEGRIVLVMDEFPYACKANSALPSALQVAIDKHLKSASIFLILCGSNQGFMEDEVLGEKSPLYGRRTAQLKLKPFDYLDASRMMPDCSAAEKFSYYASLGGTPYYLEGIDSGKNYLENMTALFFSTFGRMFDEPMMLMRQELRDPGVFNSVMRAIAHGLNKQSEIANAIGIAQGSVGFYLRTLESLGLVEKTIPFGSSAKSKKGVYRISDPAFLFWYRFVAPYVSAIEQGLGSEIAERLLSGERRNEYEGHLFERVCLEWVVRQAQSRSLPLSVTNYGTWWGPNPALKQETDIDVVASDEIDKYALVGECRWRNEINESEVFESLQARCGLLPGYTRYERYLFTKHPVSETTRLKYAHDETMHFVSIGEMYGE